MKQKLTKEGLQEEIDKQVAEALLIDNGDGTYRRPTLEEITETIDTMEAELEEDRKRHAALKAWIDISVASGKLKSRPEDKQ